MPSASAEDRARRPNPQHGAAMAMADAVNVPLVGRIAAGTPIEALQNKMGDVPVPGGMIGRGGHYALEVTGDSMINAGILDGDTVIIQEVDTATTGEIVVALVDNEEATLKRLRRRGDSIALEAANGETRLAPTGSSPGVGRAYQTMLISMVPDRFKRRSRRS